MTHPTKPHPISRRAGFVKTSAEVHASSCLRRPLRNLPIVLIRVSSRPLKRRTASSAAVSASSPSLPPPPSPSAPVRALRVIGSLSSEKLVEGSGRRDGEMEARGRRRRDGER